MPKITYRQTGGREDVVDVPEGWSLMEAAIQNDIAGIVAECGGGCACATCHVYVDEADLARLSPVSSMEGDMLECTAAERRATSRLSCQIRVSAALDGLRVDIPERQT